MQFTYSITSPEWTRIQLLCYRSRGRSGFFGVATFYLNRYLLFAVGFLLIALSAFLVLFSRWSASLAASLGVGIAWVLLGIWNLFVSKKRFRGLLLTDLKTTVDASGITAYTSNGIQSSYPWNSMTKFAEDKEFFVFFLSKIIFVPLPKRVMSEAEQSECRELAQAHIVPKKS